MTQALIRSLSVCTYPLCIIAILGIVLAIKEDKKRGLAFLIIAFICVSWRVFFRISSDRYAFFLIIPSILLLGFACTIVYYKKNITAIKVGVSIILLGTVGFCLATTFQTNPYNRFYKDLGVMISDSKKNYSNPIVLDFSKRNALRYNYYSGIETVQEDSINTQDSLFEDILYQKGFNYLQNHDAVYAIFSESNGFPTPGHYTSISRNATDKRNKRHIYVIRSTKDSLKEPNENTLHLIWEDTFDKSKSHDYVLSKTVSNIERKVLTPSRRIPVDWTINLSNGNELNSNGMIELLNDYQGCNVLHMSSDDLITIFYNRLFPLTDNMLLDLSYSGLTDSLAAIRIDYFENSHFIAGVEIEKVKTKKMDNISTIRCMIPSKVRRATHFRVSLQLKWGEVVFYNIKLFSY